MKKTEKKNKHMTLDDRIEIQECLCKGMTFKAIGERIGKSQTTISREIKLHMQPYTNSYVRSDEVCLMLLKAPFVCNGCEKKGRSSCPYHRQIYSAKSAQATYEGLLTEARSGIPLNKEAFYETERLISDAVRRGQHVYHAIQASKLPVSTATVYRHIQKKYYSIGVIDLPRAVKFKPRNTNNLETIPAQSKKGRTYDEYLDFIEQNNSLPIAQLDTVIGRIGGKTIMTVHFVNSDFMFGLLLENKTAAEATDKIQKLKLRLREHSFHFGDIVPLLLTDNGGEFSNISAFENDIDGNNETKLFFCKPRSPQEKPHIEKNHTMFRDIVPGGTSFDDFTQETVDHIFSHVNGVKRKQFNGKSAFDIFAFSYSSELAAVFGISEIPAEKVLQSPKLLKNLSHC